MLDIFSTKETLTFMTNFEWSFKKARSRRICHNEFPFTQAYVHRKSSIAEPPWSTNCWIKWFSICWYFWHRHCSYDIQYSAVEISIAEEFPTLDFCVPIFTNGTVCIARTAIFIESEQSCWKQFCVIGII